MRDYIWWDSVNKRWDLTPRALIEQDEPDVRLLINLVLRSWFIPPAKPDTLNKFREKINREAGVEVVPYKAKVMFEEVK